MSDFTWHLCLSRDDLQGTKVTVMWQWQKTLVPHFKQVGSWKGDSPQCCPRARTSNAGFKYCSVTSSSDIASKRTEYALGAVMTRRTSEKLLWIGKRSKEFNLTKRPLVLFILPQMTFSNIWLMYKQVIPAC